MQDLESPWKADWDLDPHSVYLNHGSFGPSPRCVVEARAELSRRLEQQPMDFFIRQLEPLLEHTQARLGELVGSDPRNLVLVDNATFAMNIVATSVPLQADDEVLLTDHEYGAVSRIWREHCQRQSAHVVTARLPWPPRDADELCAAILKSVTDRTRIAVISHVTSPTALVLPVYQICQELKRRGVTVCIDGPHAIAMLPVDLDRLECDFYAASCHKWLSASFGSGFLYVAPKWHDRMQPHTISWGGSLSGRAADWHDEYNWLGTRDPAAFGSIPTAIDYLESIGLDRFRGTCRQLVRVAGERLSQLPGIRPSVPLDSDWYRTMLSLKLDTALWKLPVRNQIDPLQQALWDRYRIEVPCPRHAGQRLLRVSCHLYNSESDIDRLYEALSELLI